jgi:hypothetical protein
MVKHFVLLKKINIILSFKYTLEKPHETNCVNKKQATCTWYLIVIYLYFYYNIFY